MMRSGRESKGPSSTDLLVCFPTRSHLTLMPKAICSPARSSDSSRRHHHRHNQSLQHHHLRKSIKRTGTAGQASPLSWTKTKENSTSEMDEPTSPKVTCAGQIKVRQKPSSCKNWQSVMEEIERLHNNKKKKKKKKNKWVETLVFKKEVMQFLTCLRSIKLDFRCFGSFPSSDITSDDDDDDDDDEEDEDEGNDHHDNQESRTVFSKWFMVLQENQNKDTNESSEGVVHDQAPCAPPPNALLLMRCRSAPAKSWLEEKQEEEENEDEEENEEEEEDEEEEERRKQNLVVMNYNTDFSRFSTDIVKETWVVGGNKDPLSRSRSWKR